MNDKTPWWLGNGIDPKDCVFAYQASDNWSVADGWIFSMEGIERKVKASVFFRTLLTIDQTNIVNTLMRDGNLICGVYDDWNQFCLAHADFIPIREVEA